MDKSESANKKKPKKAINLSWGGRFNEPIDEFVKRFSASLFFDKRLYNEDILGSIAHAQMLEHVGILTEGETEKIIKGLEHIKKDIVNNNFNWLLELEDVHMNIEAALIQRIGSVGKKLHTGRSRNDQVATDLRLWLRNQIDSINKLLFNLQRGIIELALSHSATIMPGFTHLQIAQPVTLGHHLLAWNEMLERDYGRLTDCRERLNQCPLGAAALAGTTFPIDRKFTASKLGFTKPTKNSLDSVSDRDFAMEFCSVASIIMSHLSRMAEELVLWTSAQFDFVTLPDRFCTGSSIMPQKKNPDVPELVRGKSGRITGNLIALLTIMKSQPLAYNKDNQEDKEPLFDTVDTLSDCLRAFSDMIPYMKIKKNNMLEASAKGFSTATDLADYLVNKNVPFREAHEIVGKSVAFAIEQGLELPQLSLFQMKGFSNKIEEDVFDILTAKGSVESRNHFGGTSPAVVAEAANRAMITITNR
ncbi:MAG: argininosuccinate lyase [Cellvibrionales bacterium TMED49]|nr:argininosuccinate lyase [Porticoccaceae bacterium]OUU38313.1 MAG: argininosuccinate lyase [Cellvibrionales bacterium TMED49]